MTVFELIQRLERLPQDAKVYRWDSERGVDGSETREVREAQMETVKFSYTEATEERVVIA